MIQNISTTVFSLLFQQPMSDDNIQNLCDSASQHPALLSKESIRGEENLMILAEDTFTRLAQAAGEADEKISALRYACEGKAPVVLVSEDLYCDLIDRTQTVVRMSLDDLQDLVKTLG